MADTSSDLRSRVSLLLASQLPSSSPSGSVVFSGSVTAATFLGDISNTTTTGLQPNAVPVSVSALISSRVDPRFFKQPGDADWGPALQAAANLAIATGKTLYIPGGILFVISQPIFILNGVLSIIGDGESSSVIVGTHNGPIFKWQINSVTQDRFAVSGFTLRGQYSASADYSASSGFQIVGDNVSYFVFGRFSDLAFQGLYTAFDITKDTQVTPFGNESLMAWNCFDRITIQGGSRPAMFGWVYHYGSGTGTTYSMIRAHIGGTGVDENGAALIRYDQGVVGDIIVVGCHLGGSGTNNAVIAVGPQTNYRNNISIVGCQLDAGMVYAFNFPNNEPRFQRIVYAGNNTGGGISVGANLPILINSRIEDQVVSENRSGNNILISDASGATGAQLFVVTLDSYTGTACELSVSGVVNNVAGGIVKARFLLGMNGGTAVVVPDGNQVSSSSANGFFNLGYNISGAAVYFYVTFTGQGGKTTIDAQICCTGGTVAVRAAP